MRHNQNEYTKFTQDKLGVVGLSYQHIDHDKSNNNFSNLITLCTVCNTKANFNRKYWVEFYRKILTDLYGY